MNDFAIEHEWADPCGARGPELRATWARLRIDIARQTITEVHDLDSRSIRSSVYLPLYPLAEWIAMNWWPLFYEVPNPLRRQYSRRHNLAAASEGFALPCLEFRSDGYDLELVWSQVSRRGQRVKFLSHGRHYLRGGLVRRELAKLVRAVLARLEDQEVHDTDLAADWLAIERADESEKIFCRLAGRLGVDPYSLSDLEAEQIIASAQLLQEAVRDEFFSTADFSQLKAQAVQLKALIQDASARESPFGSTRGLLDEALAAKRPSTSQGYEWARALRSRRNLRPADIIGSMEELGGVLGFSRNGSRPLDKPRACPLESRR
ncbi:MAG: hypothetical protein HY319_28475 [Armatimonadetes bacterium]|nr:hypothetical protein [Armatimonadota bacterium]